MTYLLRKDGGQPIRDAMKARNLSGPAVSARTKVADPTGRGISPAGVAKLASRGGVATERPRLRTCWLLALGLDEPLQALFDMPGVSTSTDERSIPHDDHRRR